MTAIDLAHEPAPSTSGERKLRMNEAIREALEQEMDRDERVFVMGEDVATYGGVFRCTAGLLERFGPERVRDTPISEGGIVGAGIGAALLGLRPVVEIMYMDFLPLAMDQLVNQWSMIPAIWDLPVPMVLRTQGGAGGSSTHHSKILEAWVTHIPELLVVAPSTPEDAKGLLISSIRDDRPVVFIEHRHIYERRGAVPEEPYETPIGKAFVRREGSDVTLISWSRMALQAEAAAEALAGSGIDAELIDLRSLVPLDMDTISRSLAKTGRAVIVHEACRRSGFGAEVAARIAEEAFDYLDYPIVRLGGLDRPVPFSPVFLPEVIPLAQTIVDAVRKLGA